MTHHFGVLIPSTNTTVETELARLPSGLSGAFRAAADEHAGTSVRAEPGRGHRLSVEAARHRQGRDADPGADLGESLRRRLRRDHDAAHERRRRGAGDHVRPVRWDARCVRSAQAHRPRVAVLGGGQRTGAALLLRQARARDRRARRLCRQRFVRHRQARTRKRARCLRPHRPAGDRRLRGARRQFPDDGLDCRVGARVRQAGGELHAGGGLGDGANSSEASASRASAACSIRTSRPRADAAAGCRRAAPGCRTP